MIERLPWPKWLADKQPQFAEVCLLIKLLSHYVQPAHSRDCRAVACVARDMRSLLLLSAGGYITGISGATFWSSRMGRVLVEVAAAAIVVGLVHVGITVRKLRQEMALRSLCRSKRLALPAVLADGISAAERQDALKTAEVISLRLHRMEDFSDESTQIFDCLMFDLFESNSGLSRELRRIAKAGHKMPRL